MTTIRLTATSTIVNGKKSVGTSVQDIKSLSTMLKALVTKGE